MFGSVFANSCPELQEALSKYHEAIHVMVKCVCKIKAWGQNGEIFTVTWVENPETEWEGRIDMKCLRPINPTVDLNQMKNS